MLSKKPGRHGSESSCCDSCVTRGQLLRETLEQHCGVLEESLGLGGAQTPFLPLCNPVNWDNLFNIFSLPLPQI